jgi:hypothetical protein
VPEGKPTAANLFKIIACLQEHEKVGLRVVAQGLGVVPGSKSGARSTWKPSLGSVSYILLEFAQELNVEVGRERGL